MTTALLQEFKDNQPDKLVETLNIDLTPEQSEYLQENRSDKRTLLLKKFNLKFSTQYSKMQITRALEVMNEPKVKPTGLKKDRHAPKNVYYRKRQKVWEARITVNKKRHLLYRGSEVGAIKAVAEFKKKNGIR
jgi:hypothetical protein